MISESISVKRKCASCGQEETITLNNTDTMLLYKGKAYHCECFEELADERVLKNNRYSLSWQDAKDSMKDLQQDFCNKTRYTLVKDELNLYLIEKYDVLALSNRFWNTVADLENGVYKNKTSKPIKIELLLDMWKFYQHILDDSYRYNMTRGKKLEGETRINYDMAIVMSKYSAYMRKISRENARIAHEKKNINNEKIQYSAVKCNVNESTESGKGLDDLSGLIDDIF